MSSYAEAQHMKGCCISFYSIMRRNSRETYGPSILGMLKSSMRSLYISALPNLTFLTRLWSWVRAYSPLIAILLLTFLTSNMACIISIFIISSSITITFALSSTSNVVLKLESCSVLMLLSQAWKLILLVFKIYIFISETIAFFFSSLMETKGI